MTRDVLEQQHQPNAADETARDGKSCKLFAACQHCYEEQRAKPDHDERPEEAPVHIA